MRGIHTVSAVVGKLFFPDADEVGVFTPSKSPAYERDAVDTYLVQVNTSEEEEPFHFAPKVIDTIQDTPGQEAASHMFSHYYRDECGQDLEPFDEDVMMAQRFAWRDAVAHRSLVYPRNQVLLKYLGSLRSAGLDFFRGNPAVGYMILFPVICC